VNWEAISTFNKTQCFEVCCTHFKKMRSTAKAGICGPLAPFTSPLMALYKLLFQQFQGSHSPAYLSFQALESLFSPWISSIQQGQVADRPWATGPVELEAASTVVQTLVECIQGLKHDPREVMDLAWRSFAQVWKSSAVHVVNVLFSKAMQLPWTSFACQRSHIADFQRLVDEDLPLYSPFLLQILAKVDLASLNAELLSISDESDRSQAFQELLRFLLTVSRNRSTVAMASFVIVRDLWLSFEWKNLSTDAYFELSSWICGNCDATELFASDSSVCSFFF
jgi:hypothetical protein